MKIYKGQISTELIVIIGIVFVIFAPLLVTVYSKGMEMNEMLATSQTRLAVTRIASLVNSVGNLGENAFTLVDVYVPKNVKSIEFNNVADGCEVVFKLETSSGINDISEPVAFKLKNSMQFQNPSEGVLRLNISSNGKDVTIEKMK